MTRNSLLFVLAAPFVFAVPAAAAQLDEVPRLSAALDSIREEALSADLYFIASDELAGRDTPSQGLEVASLFLRARLERLGFEPGAEGGYFYRYALDQLKLDLDASAFTLSAQENEVRFVFGEDYFFERSAQIAPVDVAGEIVMVGDGASKDFRAAVVEGRWALILEGKRSALRAVKRAKAAGAIGALIAPGEAYDKKPYAERFKSTIPVARDGSVGLPRKGRERKPLDLPVLRIPTSTLERLYELAGKTREGAHPPVGEELGVRAHEARVLGDPTIEVKNVCGFWPGSDPNLAKEVIIVSAHYDHVGVGKRGDIYNGADDNGSGTTGLLAIAEALTRYGPGRRSVLLLWVSGEEKGLWGSETWTLNPWLPEGHVPVCDINIDMIGRTGAETLYLTPTAQHRAYNAVARLADELAPLEGFPVLSSQDRDWGRSDHANFYKNLEIPVVFLSSGEHPDYHKPTDTADKIDYGKMRRIVRLVVRMLDGLQGDTLGAATVVAESTLPPEPAKPEPEAQPVRSPEGAEDVNLDAIADFSAPEGVREAAWARIRWHVARFVAGGDPEEIRSDREAIVAFGDPAVPALLNALKGLDLTRLEDMRSGERCQSALTAICSGHGFGWKFGTANADVYANRKSISVWCAAWERGRTDAEYWKKLKAGK